MATLPPFFLQKFYKSKTELKLKAITWREMGLGHARLKQKIKNISGLWDAVFELRDVQTAERAGVLKPFSRVLWRATEPHRTNFTQSCFRIKHFTLQWSKWFLSFTVKEPSFLYRVSKWGLFTLHSIAQPSIWGFVTWNLECKRKMWRNHSLYLNDPSFKRMLFFRVGEGWLIQLRFLLP